MGYMKKIKLWSWWCVLLSIMEPVSVLHIFISPHYFLSHCIYISIYVHTTFIIKNHCHFISILYLPFCLKPPNSGIYRRMLFIRKTISQILSRVYQILNPSLINFLKEVLRRRIPIWIFQCKYCILLSTQTTGKCLGHPYVIKLNFTRFRYALTKNNALIAVFPPLPHQELWNQFSSQVHVCFKNSLSMWYNNITDTL